MVTKLWEELQLSKAIKWDNHFSVLVYLFFTRPALKRSLLSKKIASIDNFCCYFNFDWNYWYQKSLGQKSSFCFFFVWFVCLLLFVSFFYESRALNWASFNENRVDWKICQYCWLELLVSAFFKNQWKLCRLNFREVVEAD